MSNTYYCEIASPIGTLMLVSREGALIRIFFQEEITKLAIEESWEEDCSQLEAPIRQLEQYFEGKLREFQLPLNPQGTVFQKRVWQELSRIPYGTTISYGEQAQRIGKPRAVRAVAGANGRNPLPIVVPCHRVIGKNGSLTGYGGGMEKKEWLLRHEGAL